MPAPPSAKSEAISPAHPFPIVGIGASAGGFEAFSDMLRALPANPGMALVFVQHLDPKHVSVLAQLLARESKMPVIEAKNGMRVELDHVYVIPRNTSISIINGVLQLRSREMVAGQFTSIDIFLRSLAEDQGSRAIGVVLSGNGSDGTLGLQEIKAHGGITFAQDPQTAKFDGMPRAAIVGGAVDFVRKPVEIAHEVVGLGSHPYIGSKPDEAADLLPGAGDAISRILGLVRAATGVDFAHYKTNTVRRRILRRMLLRRAETVEKYLALVRAEPAEIKALYEDILINVTEFFRDPHTFNALANQIFPRILQQRGKSDDDVRLWIPGCSTGEEVYSIAITLLEVLADQADEVGIQVFATDISEVALERARLGLYPVSIAQNVSPDRLRRFFVKSEAGYQINKRVRELCVFARHNLTKDPPFSRLDLISCRNVLIYLGSTLQGRVFPMFHYALKANGFLLLGPSETIGSYGDLFQLVDKKNKFFQRKPAPSRPTLDFTAEQVMAEKPAPRAKLESFNELDLQREGDRLILNRYAPPAVVVDEEGTILHFRGQTSPYIEPSSGAASLNVLRMLKEGLALEVKNAIAHVRKRNTSVRRDRVCFADGAPAFVNLEVIPFRRFAGNDRKYLIVFEAVAPEPVAERPKGKGASTIRETRLRRENEQLRIELAASKEYLQSTIEDQEAAHEELRSASEEIQSSNEELQSTNEELETAKEELQSTNEELNTVNEELQNRNMQLAQIGNDLLNVLANVNIPIIIVGNDLRIRRFTPAAEKALNLIPSDVGRPLHDIRLRIQVPDLEAALSAVAENLTSKVVEVSDPEGHTYSVRLRPYRTEDNKIDGIVIVFIDVDPVMRVAYATPAVMGSIEHSPGARLSLLVAQEEERRRLAHELHDELNQRLALLEFNVQSLEMRKDQDPEQIFAQLAGFRKEVAGLSEDLRRIAYQLHPAIVDDLGLVPALQAYSEEFSTRERIQVRFTYKDVPADLSPALSLALYRVVQESLRNVAKHSGARQAAVALTCSEGQLKAVIRDKGAGFNTDGEPRGGLGMLGMRERVRLVGGSINWKSKPGEGTEVTVCIPVKSDSASEPSTVPPAKI